MDHPAGRAVDPIRGSALAALIPKVSWKSIKYIPGAIRDYLRIKLLSISSSESEKAYVHVHLGTFQTTSNDWTYILVKDTNGWRVSRMQVKTGNGYYQMLASTNHFIPF